MYVIAQQDRAMLNFVVLLGLAHFHYAEVFIMLMMQMVMMVMTLQSETS